MSAEPLEPAALDRLAAMSAVERGEWMLEDCAQHEEAWILRDANGWVLQKLSNPPAGRSPYALPIWPRQELAALAALNGDEQPERVELEDLIEELLPETAERGWHCLLCPQGGDGLALEPAQAAERLSEAWRDVDEEGA